MKIMPKTTSMNIRFLVTAIRRHIAAASLTAAGMLCGSVPALAAWEHAHGDSANTGFAYVDTRPAEQPISVRNLGLVAPGANPVVAPDGTVYIGNMDGELKAFHADGTPYWGRKVNPEHGGIYSAPVVGQDGSIYVVSSKRQEEEDTYQSNSFLHKFLPGGGWLGGRPFPTHRSDGGATSAPPNIWRHNGEEAIIVPAKYRAYSLERRLIAFSTNPAVIADVLVSFTPFEITGGSALSWLQKCVLYGWWNFGIGCAFAGGLGFDSPPPSDDPNPPSSLEKAGYPMAGVAMWQPFGPESEMPPMVLASDRYDKVGYSFSPQTGFTEVFRSTTNGSPTTPPVALPDGNAVVGTYQGSLEFTAGGAALGAGALTAAPTRLPDGLLVVVSRDGYLTLVDGQSIIYQDKLTGGGSIASTAASCTHLFVSTVDELVTYDPKNMLAVARVYWQKPYVESGLHAPVIGPTGYVYVINRFSLANSDGLYVFPRPENGGVGTPTGCANN